jgi:hypothetical protein
MATEASIIAAAVPPLPNPISPNPISLFHRVWPAVVVGIGLIATAAWSGFLGYELFRLAF